MAGAMDMAGKLPKIRDEERENKVRSFLRLNRIHHLFDFSLDMFLLSLDLW